MVSAHRRLVTAFALGPMYTAAAKRTFRVSWLLFSTAPELIQCYFMCTCTQVRLQAVAFFFFIAFKKKKKKKPREVRRRSFRHSKRGNQSLAVFRL